MKKCPYCGKEYPDDATVCIIDTEPLVEYSPKSAKLKSAEPKKREPYLLFPQYQWSARDAWKCLGMNFIVPILMGIIIGVILFCLHIHTSDYRRNAFGYLCENIIFYIVILAVTLYFARTRTRPTFLNGFGLDRGVSKHAWFGIIMALAIRWYGHLYHGFVKDSNSEISLFETTIGFERYLFLVPLLLFAPFIEEIVNRGFLYKAFRGSYPTEACIVIMVAWTILTHWPECYHAPSTTVKLSLLTIIQCYLREKSGSLWDCILCHFAFNASLVFILTSQQ